MKKLTSIILGWWKFLFANRSRMAEERLSHCWKCKERKGYFCGICWCELHAKAEIKQETCPLDKWYV